MPSDISHKLSANRYTYDGSRKGDILLNRAKHPACGLTDFRIAVGFSYDANGNVTSLTRPSRPAHMFNYTPVDLESAYHPPSPLV